MQAADDLSRRFKIFIRCNKTPTGVSDTFIFFVIKRRII